MTEPAPDPTGQEEGGSPPSYWTAKASSQGSRFIGCIVIATVLIVPIVWFVVALSFFNATTGEPEEGTRTATFAAGAVIVAAIVLILMVSRHRPNKH